MLLLAPITYEDTAPVINEKINLVSRFIDLLITARTTNYRSVDYNTIKNYVFNITKDIRRVSVGELKVKLLVHYNKLEYNAAETIRSFGLNSFTKTYIKHMLARVTSFIEEGIGVAPGYVNYMNTNTKNPFEIEHVLPDHYEWFTEEYADQEDFKRWRNNIGGLLLLHKSINASLNDKKYDYKIQKYCSAEGNIYTESLGPLAYMNNPQFMKFVKTHKLTFEAYDKFGKDEITKRNVLFAQLVTLIWNTQLFECD